MFGVLRRCKAIRIPSQNNFDYGTLTIVKFLGPRARRPKKLSTDKAVNDEKRPRTAFSGPQLVRLKVLTMSYIIFMKNNNTHRNFTTN